MRVDHIKKMVASRARLPAPVLPAVKLEAEGGCGVIGVASTVSIEGKYLLQSLLQMKNRGNGKGRGIAAVGLGPEHLGVSREVLDQDYLIEIAYLDSSVRNEVEAEFIESAFLVDHSSRLPTVRDHRSAGLEVKPPEGYAYFCRVRPEVLEEFSKNNHLRAAG